MDLEYKITDLRKTLKKLEIFSITLDSILIFLFSMLILNFLRIFWLYGIFPAIFYFVFKFVQKYDESKAIYKTCKNCPEIEEKLKTAYDNRTEKNFIVKKLLRETSAVIDSLEESEFINMREISLKIFLAMAIIFIFMLFSAWNFNVLTLKKNLNFLNFFSGIMPEGLTLFSSMTPEGNANFEEFEKSNYTNVKEKEKIGLGDKGEIPGFSKGPIPGRGQGAGSVEDTDIFSEKKSVKIYGENVIMRVYPEYGGEIEIKEQKTRKFSEEISIKEAKASEIPSEESLKYEEIVKKYFEKLLAEEEKKKGV
ncbi:MAG: hypothetical protein QXY62_04045 [Candidatus Altiarchaeota archaeon]